ncbi:MogA/MoaB family molybdenum cofactor biosynthesis protein [Candidatus Bipolaricaulota bacterium]|nr:MogA/MoaB family molybdenum cofactor biosynthesis protein [Candidatus Bipolaricaulota bacterium]MCK5586389.1 MogA/MoaB family molybdenum cofactor biosynthesis protein [Candidatus Bipolaricaulota bacterium]
MNATAIVITLSDKVSAGEREDRSGPILVSSLQEMGIRVAERLVLPDERDTLSTTLVERADSGDIDLIITTGGTGLAPRDVTPEATQAVLDRELPGVAEMLRAEGYKNTPFAVLSRGLAGSRKQCVIINLPGSPKAVAEGMKALEPILLHAIQMTRGEDLDHG